MLHIAAMYHNEQVVLELLENGASTNVVSEVINQKLLHLL